MSWRLLRQYKRKLTPRAYDLRLQSTPAETKLWAALRNLRFRHAIKFRRQQPIGPYIADFYCPWLKCVVEVDGLSHEYKQKKDKARDEFMKNKGLTVLRFTECQVLEDCDAIIQTIVLASRTPPLTPPSRGGE